MDVVSTLNAISQFSDRVNEPPVSLVAGACVHDQHKQATCDRCVTACPTGAFDIADGQITLTADRCVRCGYCVHACPTGAVSGQTGAEKLLRRVAQNSDQTHIELACGYRPKPYSQTDPEATLFITPRCLAALSVANYVELANQGVSHVTIRVDACASCPIGQVADQIHKTAETAHPLTAVPPAMQLDVVTDTPPAGKTPPVIHDVNRPEMSRRGLFQMFTDELRVEEPESSTPVFSSLLPPQRQRLLAALQARPEDPPAWAPSLDVVGDCTACEVCTSICPTNALVIEKGRAQFQLQLNAAHCTGCGLCTAACPENALQPGEESLPAVPGANTLMPLASGELRQCPRCKTTFSGSSDLCPACAFRRQNPFGSYVVNCKKDG